MSAQMNIESKLCSSLNKIVKCSSMSAICHSSYERVNVIPLAVSSFEVTYELITSRCDIDAMEHFISSLGHYISTKRINNTYLSDSHSSYHKCA